jgi:hypothetical protein
MVRLNDLLFSATEVNLSVADRPEEAAKYCCSSAATVYIIA